MASRFYVLNDQRAARVRDLFASIAGRYDLINDLQSFGLHRYWKYRLVGQAAILPGEVALDLCCGTGDVVFALAAAGGVAFGLDFTEPMLRQALRRRAPALPSGAGRHFALSGDLGQRVGRGGVQTHQASFLCADALRIPFPDASFNVVTISYGLRNLSDIDAGIHEISRVLKPGGRALVLDFGKPSSKLWRLAYFQYLQRVVPVFGKVFCGDADAYSYILESLRDYPAQDGVAALMRASGFRSVTVTNFLGGVTSIHSGFKRDSK